MTKIYTKNTWVDEVLAASPEKYQVRNDSGQVVYNAAEIALATGVVQAGTAVTATRMNNLENGLDALDTRVDGDLVRLVAIQVILGDGVSVLSTGLKGFVEVPFGCTIEAVTLLADVSGSCVIDIWKDTYANFPPTVADTITASAKPTLSSAQRSQNLTLTGWNRTLNAGDILAFNVDSGATLHQVTLSLRVRKSAN